MAIVEKDTAAVVDDCGHATSNAATRNYRKRRILQFSTRSLLILPLLVAGVVVAGRQYLSPFRVQQQVAVFLKDQGGSFKTVTGGPNWLRVVVDEEYLQNVVQVDLADSEWTEECRSQVLQLRALEALVVGGRQFSDADLRYLTDIDTLRVLILDTTRVSDRGIAAARKSRPDWIVHQSSRRAIKALEEFGSSPGTELVGPTALRKQFSDAYFDDATGRYCAIGPELTDAQMPDIGALSRLKRMYLDCSNLSDTGIQEVGRMTNLQELFLMARGKRNEPPKTKITSQGIAALRQLPNLNRLGFRRLRVGDAEVAQLSNMTNLRELDLAESDVTDAGLVSLYSLSNLRYLDLDGTQTTAEAVARLQEALPRCEIDH